MYKKAEVSAPPDGTSAPAPPPKPAPAGWKPQAHGPGWAARPTKAKAAHDAQVGAKAATPTRGPQVDPSAKNKALRDARYANEQLLLNIDNVSSQLNIWKSAGSYAKTLQQPIADEKYQSLATSQKSWQTSVAKTASDLKDSGSQGAQVPVVADLPAIKLTDARSFDQASTAVRALRNKVDEYNQKVKSQLPPDPVGADEDSGAVD